MFNIFLYLNLCGKNCFLKKLVGQNVRQTFVFVRQFLCWVGQCPMSDRYFKHWFEMLTTFFVKSEANPQRHVGKPQIFVFEFSELNLQLLQHSQHHHNLKHFENESAVLCNYLRT